MRPEPEARQLNRAERREYVRRNQPSRQVRKYIVGFGRWRRHVDPTEESWAKQTALPVQHAPRAERRPAMIRSAKVGRKIRRRLGGS